MIQKSENAKIDIEQLKKREPIGWYRDIRLYDDEIDDNGAVSCSIKIRIMPSCFFILVRYYLRVDKGNQKQLSENCLFFSNRKSTRLPNLSRLRF